jgi:hypothetical protein
MYVTSSQKAAMTHRIFMMLQSILELDEPEARVMYRNLHNLVERAVV